MKKLLLSLFIFLFCFVSVFAKGQKEDSDALVVYCYDSFTGDWGAGTAIAERFTEKTGISVTLVGCGGSVETYTKVLFEGKNCRADMVVGIDDTTAVDPEIFEDLTAFDYGVPAFVYDTYSNSIVPHSLWELSEPQFSNHTILADPRTSSAGLGLLKWTVEAFGEDKALEWWKAMKDNCLTMASSWSTAYGLFTEHEAPLVISWTTSPVYHILNENSDRYQALEFSEGHIKTTEYMGILKTSDKKEWARAFEDFILSEGQTDIAIANTMFPANSDAVLPQAFDLVIKPKLIDSDSSFSENKDQILNRWIEAMAR